MIRAGDDAERSDDDRAAAMRRSSANDPSVLPMRHTLECP